MKNVKEAVMTACAGVVVSTALLATPAQAEEKSYVARMNDDGKYCARVEIRGVAGLVTRKNKCRTIEEWVEHGYLVNNVETGEE